ncbi:MAG: hypothetical protein ACPGQP_03975 [Nitrosopumilus sp.]
MTTTYSKNKKSVFPALAALFAIIVIAVGVQSVQAQTTEESNIDQLYEELDSQYDAILEKYGFVTPNLTTEQEIELDAELAPLDEKYMELEDEFDYYEISPEMEKKYKELDMQYYAILEQFGFLFPELTEEQEIELDSKLVSLDEQYEKIFEELDQDTLTEEEQQRLESSLDELDAKQNKILQEFGIVEPILTEQQEMELEELLSPISEQYNLLDEQHDSFDEKDADS